MIRTGLISVAVAGITIVVACGQNASEDATREGDSIARDPLEEAKALAGVRLRTLQLGRALVVLDSTKMPAVVEALGIGRAVDPPGEHGTRLCYRVQSSAGPAIVEFGSGWPDQTITSAEVALESAADTLEACPQVSDTLLLDRRVALGMTQAALTDRLGVPDSIEERRVRYVYDREVALSAEAAGALGTDVYFLTSGIEAFFDIDGMRAIRIWLVRST